MARKKITADLNGGDAITAMGDLLFQVHDASDDSIIATANYAAIGSVNTPGSDSSNIGYTLDINGGAGAGGQIILDGIDVGAVTSVKIRAKDESGNESVLSNSFSTTLFLFKDEFIGLTLDVAKWNKIIAEPASVTITQNDELRLAVDSLSTGGTLVNYVRGVNAIDLADIEAISWDVTAAIQANDDWSGGITKDAVVSDNSNRISIQRDAGSGTVLCIVKESGVTTYSSAVTLDISVVKSLKISKSGTAITFYYWNGSVWTLLTSTTTTLTGNVYPYVAIRNTTTGSGLVVVDNFIVVDTDFSTQRP